MVSSANERSIIKNASEQIGEVSLELTSISQNLVADNKDKSLSIVQSKLQEIAKELNSISSELGTFNQNIENATNRVNREIEEAQRRNKV